MSMTTQPAPDLRALAIRLLDICLECLDDALGGGDVDIAVHETRRVCKQLRALLRLARTHNPELFDEENAATRDAAALLSDLRDATVTLHARAALDQPDADDQPMGLTSGEVDGQHDTEMQGLADSRADLLRIEARPTLRACHDALAAQRQRCTAWDLPRWDQPAEAAAIITAWTDTYRAARRAGKVARKHPTTKNLHEWRKRAKDHRLQIEFLADLDPSFADRASALHQLTDLLGDDHDLAVLASTLPKQDGARMATRIADRRHRLQAQARKSGKALFAMADDEMAQWFRHAIARA